MTFFSPYSLIFLSSVSFYFLSINFISSLLADVRLCFIDPFDLNYVNENLNKKITQIEILDCIKRLKNNKAHGDDHVINEYIKSTSDKTIDVYI
jgi:hypothetical protein